jgi:acyl-CoA dehydrogenase
MINEWEILQQRDLPEKVWKFIKEKGFLGLVIAKKYGGKGFSARAHSEVVMKIASRSGVGVVTVMVPNSLGPGELLQYYGTEEQREHYLPKLAKGQLIPCFALTEPGAGSDATSIESEAIVKQKTVKGKKELFLSISLNKRWITLAPIATLIGVAVNLKDPDGLLKDEGEAGITCVLIPRETPNLEIGNRHYPANEPFMNGTVRGNDILVPISSIIGGQKNAGKGWQMLFECLSIGRSISLPALGTATSALSYITSSAYAKIRRQFNLEICQFEGIQEKLAQIAGLHYLINATRLLTVSAVDKHLKPSVSSGLTKYLNTELARQTINDAMDVHAGRAVVIGPRNYLFSAYQSIPISITVEGANIMSRNLLIFGQGSMACHPYLRQEFYAISQNDEAAFNPLFWQHTRYTLKNLAKAICSAFTGGLFITSRKHKLKREVQKLTHLSQTFAFLADAALIVLGGKLKRKERLSARLADAMTYLYAAMAVIHYFETFGQTEEDAIHAKWATHYGFYQAQRAMIEFCQQFPIRPLGLLFRVLACPFGQTMKKPNDKLDQLLAKTMCTNNAYRNRLKNNLFLTNEPQEAVDRVEMAFQMVLEHENLYQKIPELKRYKFHALKIKLAEQVKDGKLTQAEMDTLVSVERARWDAEQVDEFEFDSFNTGPLDSITDKIQNPLDA